MSGRWGMKSMPLNLCAGRVGSADVAATVSYPSIDVSLKDGFAVKSSDVDRAGRDAPVRLNVIGVFIRRRSFGGRIRKGDAVRLCSGSPIPDGADAVVSGEFCEEGSSGDVFIRADAGPGRNILQAGVEVAAGATIIRRGKRITPGRLGLAAAAGISTIRVHRRPRVAIISIGDEVVAPGETLHAGQLYASNLVTMEAWLASFGIPCVTSIVPDDVNAIKRALKDHLPRVDVILTSGGAWGSERDLVVGVLDELGWAKRFHYVRMGPGKGIAFGSLGKHAGLLSAGRPAQQRDGVSAVCLARARAHGRRREAPASDCACPVGRRREGPASGMDGIQGCRGHP